MSQWARKYGDKQRAAIVHAALDLRITPRSRIKAMAAAGELRPASDEPFLEPFTIPEASIAYIAKTAERKRLGEAMPKRLADLKPRDRAEALQRRLTTLIDAELEKMEGRQRRNHPLDWEQVRKAARALRELGTLPDAKDMRLPRTPGDRVPGTQELPDAKTTGGLAGQLLAASNRHAPTIGPRQTIPSDEVADEAKETTTDEPETTSNDETTTRSERNEHEHDDDRDGNEGACRPDVARDGAFGAAVVLTG